MKSGASLSPGMIRKVIATQAADTNVIPVIHTQGWSETFAKTCRMTRNSREEGQETERSRRTRADLPVLDLVPSQSTARSTGIQK